MVIKRKRSESELSISSTFSSPQRPDNGGFNFRAMMETNPPRAFSLSYLPSSRTMKRIRDNRPSEAEVHRITHPQPTLQGTATTKQGTANTVTARSAERRSDICPFEHQPLWPATVAAQLLESTSLSFRLCDTVSFSVSTYCASTRLDKLRGLRGNTGRRRQDDVGCQWLWG
ncbi:hypothetical protein B0H63DRAFT_81959 [Podospora didyma]|uniref:Uncharacterized protein n=1 Tax=Podospora didyma TaxID=330526 RepID=A0AAE0JZW9_9PEZI|nr:hypothetical protein B0H63DRAFT_81959 [Podospora didyma]